MDGALVDAGSLWPNGFVPEISLRLVNGTQQRLKVFREKCNKYALTASPCF